MLPIRLTTLMTLLLIAATAGAQDRVALVHYRADTRKQKALFFGHASNGPASPFVGQAVTSAMGLPKVAGKKPLRYAFPADWDGDGIPELVLVREFTSKADRRMDLRIYRMPDELFDRLGGKLASSRKRDLGCAAGDGRIVALGSGNAYPGDADELWVVRESLSGQQSLEVRSLPPGKQQEMGPPLLSDASFGVTADNQVVSLFGSDIDDDGQDEIVTLVRNETGVERVKLFQTPQTPDGETGPSFASYLDVTPGDGFQNIAMSGLDVDGDGLSELLLQQRSHEGVERLVVYAMPTAPSQALGTPLAVAENPGLADASYPLLAAFCGMPIPAPPDYSFLEGFWSFWIEAWTPEPFVTVQYYGPFNTEATMIGDRLVLNVADLSLSLTGTVSLSDTVLATIAFENSSFSIPFPDASRTMTVTYGSGVVTNQEGQYGLGLQAVSGLIINNATGSVHRSVEQVYLLKGL